MVSSDPDGTGQKERLSRIEREVLEILEKSETESPPVTDMVRWKVERERRASAVRVRSLANQIQERMTPGLLLVFGVLLAVMSYASRHVSTFMTRGFAIAALVCLILPFIMHWRQPDSPTTGPKRWRGKDISLDAGRGNPIEDLKRWWKNRT